MAYSYNHGKGPHNFEFIDNLTEIEPDGANLSMADGSAQWVDFEEMEPAIQLSYMGTLSFYWKRP